MPSPFQEQHRLVVRLGNDVGGDVVSYVEGVVEHVGDGQFPGVRYQDFGRHPCLEETSISVDNL